MAKIKILESDDQAYNLFSRPHIVTEEDLGGVPIVFIETQRFTAKSLYSSEKSFDKYNEEIQKLYSVTFSDKDVMKLYASGETRSQEKFAEMVNLQSLRWQHEYPFAGFIVTDNDSGEVVGYEIIGNSDAPNQGELAYLFNKNYHRSENIQYVGFENVSALVLEYGQSLYKKNALVNQLFDFEQNKFTGGELFTTITATSRIDNLGSHKILSNLKFTHVEDSLKFGHSRHVFNKCLDDAQEFFMQLCGLLDAVNTNDIISESLVGNDNSQEFFLQLCGLIDAVNE